MLVNVIRKPDLINVGNKIEVYVNDKPAYIFLNNEEQTNILLEDYVNNIVCFKMSWCYSNKLKINSGEINNKSIKLSYRITEKQKIIIVFGIMLFMFLTIVINIYFLIGMLISLIYPIYLITIGRKYFLKAEFICLPSAEKS